MLMSKHCVLLLLVLLVLQSREIQGQQPYIDNRQLDCYNTAYDNLTRGFDCNGVQSSCQSYLTFRSNPLYNSAVGIGYLLGVNPTLIAYINDLTSDVATIPTDTVLVVPVNCSCSSLYYQYNVTYRLKDKTETYFIVANNTFQGLSTCQAMISQNQVGDKNLSVGLDLLVPLRCACPTSNQIASGINYLLTYMVTWVDSFSYIDDVFGVDQQTILDANQLSKDQNIYPFTTILVPLNTTPTTIEQSPPSPPPAPANSSFKPRLTIIAVLIVASVVVLTTIGGVFYVARKKKYEEINEDWEREYGPQRFSYKNLCTATKGFKDNEIIGKGGFGKVYKGVLPTSNLQIAVKRISHDSKQGMKEFVAEIVSIGKLRHRNLVQLRGYCRLRGELLLVYDYMPNGSLDKLLYSNKKSNLDWFHRFRIIRGVASGLLYLHEEWEQVVLHRDIKPGNVLLDADLNGKLGDFGLARLHDHGSNPQTTKLVGTIGYMAPELPTTGKASTSTDVYAFGVFMLEVASGKRPMEQRGFVIDCWRRGAILDASDPNLEGSYAEVQMELVLKLGLICSHPNPTARPSMRQVMQYLDGDAMLPDIPSDNVIDFVSATNQSSDLVLFAPLLGSDSAQIMSTTDSILLEGR